MAKQVDCSPLALALSRLILDSIGRTGKSDIASVLADIRKTPGLERMDERTLRDSLVEVSGGKAAAIDKIGEDVKEVRKAARTPREKDLASRIESLRKRLAEREDQIAAGTVPERKTVKAVEPEIAELQAKNAEAGQVLSGRRKASDLQENLDAGTVPETKERTTDIRDELAEVRQQTQQLRKELADSPAGQNKRLDNALKRIDRQIQQVQESGDVPAVRRPGKNEEPSLDIFNKEFALWKKKQQLKDMRDGPEPLTPWRALTGLANTIVDLKTTLDLPMGRQGALYALAHPLKAAGIVWNTKKGVFSEKEAWRIQKEIDDDPRRGLEARSGLRMDSLDGQHTPNHQEHFRGGIVDKIPGVSHSKRAHVLEMNSVRKEWFNSQCDALGREPTLKEAEVFSSLVNIATGKGSMGGLEPAVNAMSLGVFSLRNTVSRFQYALMPAWLPFKGGITNNWQAKRIALKEISRSYAGAAIALTLAYAAGARVSLDRNSSDYLKIRIGNRRYDILGSLGQAIVFMSRSISGKYTNSTTGVTTDLRGPNKKFTDPDWMDVAANYARNKASPLAGATINILMGKGGDGQPRNLTSVEGAVNVASDLFAPINLEDIRTEMKNNGFTQATIDLLITGSGIGMVDYGPGDKKKQAAGVARSAGSAGSAGSPRSAGSANTASRSVGNVKR